MTNPTYLSPKILKLIKNTKKNVILPLLTEINYGG